MKIVRRTFNRILTMMAIDWEMCSNTKFNTFATYNAKLSQRFANMTAILYLVAVVFFSSNILIKRTDYGTATNISRRLFILEMDFPFDTNRRYVFESVIIVQFFHLLLCSEAIALLNVLLMNLVSYAKRYCYCKYYFCCL